MFIRGFALTLLACGALSVSALDLGATAPSLEFKDIRYLPRGIEDMEPRKAYVLAFVALEDPASVALLDGLKALRAELPMHEIEIAALSTGTEDSISAFAAHIVRLDTPVTVLKDREGKAAAALGVAATPTTIVLDTQKRLVYRGTLDGARQSANALLAGDTPTPHEEAAGTRALVLREAPETTTPVTYAEHVAPIMNQHCVVCHREGRATPFTLGTYEDVAARANMIREVVLDERMPPWYAAPGHDEFVNARRLSQAEKDHVAQWLRGGKQSGDLAKAPAPPAFPQSEWEIPEPDLILQIPELSELPESGFVPYKYVVLPYQFPGDTWIQGLEILPTNKPVVHHANIAYNLPTGGYAGDFQFLTGYVPGGSPAIMEPETAMLIPKGAVLMLQIHYVTTGKPETEQMRVGVRYARGEVKKRVYYERIRPKNDRIQIEPGNPFWPVSADWKVDKNAMVIAMFSHMHVRGRDMEFLATYPDGREESLLLIPNYSFDWQMPYLYAPGTKTLPIGTQITTRSHYDNSAFNAYNPDPKQVVPYGDQTIHEMNDAYIFYLDNDETLSIHVDPKTGQAMDPSLASAK